MTAAPTLKRHKRSGNGYARFNGKQFWFGRYDDPEAHARFAAFKARWEARGRQLPAEGDGEPTFTVADLVALYLRHAEVYYRRPDGSQTQEVANIVYSMKPLVRMFASLPAQAFKLRMLKQVRAVMVESGLARPTVNIRIGRVVRLFRWGAEEEYVPPAVFGELRALVPLKRGRTEAYEPAAVKPVSWSQVEGVLDHLPSPVRDMVLLMWQTGMRPGEARRLTLGALDRSQDVWIYRPGLHKTQHHGRERAIAIGPEGTKVLRPYLLRVPALAPDVPLFSPRDAMAERHRRARKGVGSSRPKCSAGDSRAEAGLPKQAYSKDSLNRAIRRACDAAGIVRWTPNQLRHAAATRIRTAMGIDAARAVLGHASAGTTEVYAELDFDKAREAMRRLG